MGNKKETKDKKLLIELKVVEGKANVRMIAKNPENKDFVMAVGMLEKIKDSLLKRIKGIELDVKEGK
jgi:hypothetical protein